MSECVAALGQYSLVECFAAVSLRLFCVMPLYCLRGVGIPYAHAGGGSRGRCLQAPATACPSALRHNRAAIRNGLASQSPPAVARQG